MCAAVCSLRAGHCFDAAAARAYCALQSNPTDWPLLLQLVELLHKLGRHNACLSAIAPLDSASSLIGDGRELLVKLRILLVKAACLVAIANQQQAPVHDGQRQSSRVALEG